MIEEKLKQANEKLKLGEFENAYGLFGDIIRNHGNIASAYWGMLLAKNKVKNDEELANIEFLTIAKSMEYKSACSCAKGEQKKYYRNFIEKSRNGYDLNLYQNNYNQGFNNIYNAFENLNVNAPIGNESKMAIYGYHLNLEKIKNSVKKNFELEKRCAKFIEAKNEREILMLILKLVVGIIYIGLILFLPEEAIIIKVILIFGFILFCIKFTYEYNLYLKYKEKLKSGQNGEGLKTVLDSYKTELRSTLRQIADESRNEIETYNKNFKTYVLDCDVIQYASEEYIYQRVFSNDSIKRKVEYDFNAIYEEVARYLSVY